MWASRTVRSPEPKTDRPLPVQQEGGVQLHGLTPSWRGVDSGLNPREEGLRDSAGGPRWMVREVDGDVAQNPRARVGPDRSGVYGGARGIAQPGRRGTGLGDDCRSFQDELGCAGDWMPECALTHLAFDAEDAVWQAAFDLPAGNSRTRRRSTTRGTRTTASERRRTAPTSPSPSPRPRRSSSTSTTRPTG